MQYVHCYICCIEWSIDLHYLSAALCSRMQSSGPVRDSRREPSASKFNRRQTNTAAAAIINGLSTSQPGFLCVLPADTVKEIAFSSLITLWLNRSPATLRVFLQWSSLSCYMLSCSHPHILSWGHCYVKRTQWRLPVSCCGSARSSAKLWESWSCFFSCSEFPDMWFLVCCVLLLTSPVYDRAGLLRKQKM